MVNNQLCVSMRLWVRDQKNVVGPAKIKMWWFKLNNEGSYLSLFSEYLWIFYMHVLYLNCVLKVHATYGLLQYYYEPMTGHKFRSLREVERYVNDGIYTPRRHRSKTLKLGYHGYHGKVRLRLGRFCSWSWRSWFVLLSFDHTYVTYFLINHRNQITGRWSSWVDR